MQLTVTASKIRCLRSTAYLRGNYPSPFGELLLYDLSFEINIRSLHLHIAQAFDISNNHLIYLISIWSWFCSSLTSWFNLLYATQCNNIETRNISASSYHLHWDSSIYGSHPSFLSLTSPSSSAKSGNRLTAGKNLQSIKTGSLSLIWKRKLGLAMTCAKVGAVRLTYGRNQNESGNSSWVQALHSSMVRRCQ